MLAVRGPDISDAGRSARHTHFQRLMAMPHSRGRRPAFSNVTALPHVVVGRISGEGDSRPTHHDHTALRGNSSRVEPWAMRHTAPRLEHIKLNLWSEREKTLAVELLIMWMDRITFARSPPWHTVELVVKSAHETVGDQSTS